MLKNFFINFISIKMPVNIQSFIDIIAELCNEKELKCAVTESLKGGLTTGVSAVVGGLLFGPFGLVLGGAIGGGISAINSQNKFKPVAVVLRDMSASQKQKLYDKIKFAFKDFGPQDVATLSMLILSQASFKELAIRETINFLKNDMLMNV